MNKYYSDIPGLPSTNLPYSPAVESNGLIFISGQVGLDPATGALAPGGIEAQATQILKNLKSILSYLSLDFSHVVKTTIFLTNLAVFQKVNALYQVALEGNKPARSTVQVAGLPLGAEIEIEMIAVRPHK